MGDAVRIRKHSILQSAVLHLLPGVLIAIFYIGSAPYVARLGLPVTFAFDFAVIFVLIPLELGYLFVRGKKKNHKLSLEKVLHYRERMPVWQYVIFFPILLIWAGFCFVVIPENIDKFVIKSLLIWSPDRFSPSLGYVAQYPEGVLLVIGTISLLLSGIAAPLVEELYFRGYLLPRISSRMKGWTPGFNVLLYSLYHLWTPGQIPIIFLAFLPLVYVVWWKRNIYLSILVHCALNMLIPIALLKFPYQ